jgi:carboxyl-terminal processing protease
MPNSRRRWPAFCVGCVCGTVVALCVTSTAAAGPPPPLPWRVLSQVLTHVEQQYVDDVQVDDLIYDAIKGMFSHLDPFTVFLRAEEYARFREDTAGAFGGLGLELRSTVQGGRTNVVAVSAVHADTPSAHAGIKVGDILLAIDDKKTDTDDLTNIIQRLRGEPGSRVVLRVKRASWPAHKDIPLLRREIEVPSVVVDVVSADRGPVGYIHIRSFQENTDRDVGRALESLRKRAVTGLVLDLRDNAGGLLDEGVRVADRFLTAGLIVTTEGRDPRNTTIERAHTDGHEPTWPIVVLINRGTASASEIVAGALQDQHRAKLVGVRSYGKGSVQTLFGLEGGAGLKMTVAKYRTPSGRSIHGKGIDPDITVSGDTSTQPAPLAKDAFVVAGLAALGK